MLYTSGERDIPVRGERSDGSEMGANRWRSLRGGDATLAAETAGDGGATPAMWASPSDGAAHSARDIARGPQQPEAHHQEATRFGKN